MKILILGANGMLGHAIHRTFSNAGRDVVGTVRAKTLPEYKFTRNLRYVSGVDATDFSSITNLIRDNNPDVVINALGVIKQRDDANDEWNLMQANAAFPQHLQLLAEISNFKIIHFSTDCVFSGAIGDYHENDVPDAKDWYGLSKYLGEIRGEKSLTLRTSIIGRGLVSNNSLIDWFLSQQGTVSGYSKAIFSGLPVDEVANILNDNLEPALLGMSGLYHLSAEPISKYALLNLVKETWDHAAVEIVENRDFVIDRSLNSNRFRAQTRYSPLSWPELIKNMYKFYEG